MEQTHNKKPDKGLRKLWYFIWEDNSVLSWIVNVVLAFIIIKFLVYPGLGFILSTSNPVVAVVSCSMEHKPTNCGLATEKSLCGQTFSDNSGFNFDDYWNICGEWYENRNISKEDFSNFQYSNGFNRGDLIILKGREELSAGQIVVFNAGEKDPVIHRLIQSEEQSIATKGDNNVNQLPYEHSISKEQIIGHAFIKIPLLGYVKIVFTDVVKLIGVG